MVGHRRGFGQPGRLTVHRGFAGSGIGLGSLQEHDSSFCFTTSDCSRFHSLTNSGLKQGESIMSVPWVRSPDGLTGSSAHVLTWLKSRCQTGLQSHLRSSFKFTAEAKFSPYRCRIEALSSWRTWTFPARWPSSHHDHLCLQSQQQCVSDDFLFFWPVHPF